MPPKTLNLHYSSLTARSRLGWLTTFNDMVTLLMVFFVLLFAMGSMDVQRFKHFQNALQSALGVLNAGRKAPVGLIDEKEMASEMLAQPDKIVGRQGASASRPATVEDLHNTQGIEAEYTPKGIQLILEDKLLFRSASARLTPPGRQMLEKVAAVIGPMNRGIQVEGHTDNVPIKTARYASNWELSTARAVQVVKFFVKQCGIAPERLSAAGYGSVKPRFSNDTAVDRARNRRVELILAPADIPTTKAD